MGYLIISFVLALLQLLHTVVDFVLLNVICIMWYATVFLIIFLLQVVDIVLHCLDPGHLKTRGLADVFPAVCRFNQVSHCPSTRRIAVGAKNGQVALYELRSQKCQVILLLMEP